MSDVEDSRAAVKWRRRRWRREWIAKFAERQRVARRWIACIDLVEWCAQSTTAASLSEEAEARQVAYQRLADSVWKGEFESDSRSKILYLNTFLTSSGASARCRLTREGFEIAAGLSWTPSLPIDVLNCCWLPCDLARHWIEAHGYHWSARFEAVPKKQEHFPRRVDGEPEIAQAPAAQAGVVDNLTRTGYPGRPSKGKHLIEDEFCRRVAAGEAAGSLAAEARALLAWYGAKYPEAPRPTGKTIENNIRAGHPRWVASRKQNNPS